MLIALFSERIADSAHFISSFARELMFCILNTQKDRQFVPPEEINNTISKHAFLTHFSSNTVLQAASVHPTMQLYFCLELINVVYPVLTRQADVYQAQINILHETLFVLTDFGGGSQLNPLIDMLLLQTFSTLRENLFRQEFKRRLPKALATILKPKTIEECPGLNSYATGLLVHI